METGLCKRIEPEENRRVTLDGIRGAAALLVAFYHFQQRMGVEPIHGYLAVDLFFVLSGFVLTERYSARFAAGLSWRQFGVQRFWRFYPLYALSLPLGIAWQLSGLAQPPEHLSTSALAMATGLGLVMAPVPDDGGLYPLNGAAWSLLFELGVNLLLAAWLWRLRNRALAMVAMLALLILTLTSHDPQHMNMGWRWHEAGGAVARTLFSFVMGMLIQRASGSWRLELRWLSPVLIVAALLPPILLPGGPWEDVWELGTVALVFPAIVMLGAAVAPLRLMGRPMAWLGALSFPLYAIHWPLAALVGPWLAAMPFWGAALVFTAIALMLAWAAERWFDRPVRAWVNKRRPDNAPQASPAPMIPAAG